MPFHTRGRSADAAAVLNELGDILARTRGRFGAPTSAVSLIWEEIDAEVRCGKLLRPLLFLAVHSRLDTGTQHTGTALRLAACIELLHQALLIHDDVIDDDFVRRGRPNLIARFGDRLCDESASSAERRSVGQACGLLAGTLLHTLVYEEIARLDAPAPVRETLLTTLSEVLHHTVEGEIDDIRYAQPSTAPGLDDVLTMTHAKTSYYSLALPIRWACILSEVEPPSDLDEYTRLTGLGYQLQDDLLSVFGDPALVGKEPLNDVRAGKRTALVAYAMRTEYWQDLGDYIGRAQLAEHDMVAVRTLLEQAGVRSQVERDVAAAYAGARATLCEEEPITAPLLALIDSLEGRER